MKKIIITNAISIKAKERHSGLKDFEIEGMDTKDDFYNAMQVSDGYHTIDDLYEHRIRLFIALCQYFIQGKASYDSRNVWRSWLHSDGSRYDGWFIMGIGSEAGNQITYHLPAKYWDEVSKFTEERERSPEYDGHTANDVLERLKNIYV